MSAVEASPKLLRAGYEHAETYPSSFLTFSKLLQEGVKTEKRALASPFDRSSTQSPQSPLFEQRHGAHVRQLHHLPCQPAKSTETCPESQAKQVLHPNLWQAKEWPQV